MTARSPRCLGGLLLALLSGCRATATVGHDDGGMDLAVPDGGDDLAAPSDFALAPPDLACTGPTVPEICGNGCDDDRNGYVDDDDPACTTQMLVTFQSGSPALARLIVEPAPRLVTVDGNAVAAGAFAEHQRAFSSAAYLAVESVGGYLRRLELPDGGSGAFTDYAPGYITRDVCVFNGELLVVERNLSSNLHRLKPDGKTELGVVPLGSVFASACASDGKLLYVAVHDQTMGPSQFWVFDKTYAQVATLAIPPDLGGLVHCLDLAWTKKSGFYGLFTANLDVRDPVLSADQIFPFAFDGGVGAPIDAGRIHGLGEFLP